MTVTAKDLRFNISMLFETLSRGEDIIITYRGKAKAKLIPTNNKNSKKEDIAFGIWDDQKNSVDEVVRSLRRGRSFDI